MTCDHVHVGGACVTICRSGETRRRVHHCPTCERRRRFAVLVAEWYPAIWTCCTCGDSWSEGGRMDRPFARGWRAESSRRAKRAWAAAGESV